MREFDVLVVGAGTAGCYFAKRMAEQGYHVLVVDRSSEKKVGTRLDIFHIDKCFFERARVPQPEKGDDDYVGEFEYSMCESAYGHYPKKTLYPFIVMRLPQFLKRLRDWSTPFGVEYQFDTEFKDFRYNDKNQIVGVTLEKDGATEDVSCRLVADCAGIDSPARCKLPDGYGIENKEISERDRFYVILRYVKLKNPTIDRVRLSTGYPFYKTWIAPQSDADGAIIGVGANLSYEYAEKCFADFEKSVKLPEYDLEHIEKGTTPYRRAPYTMVADGYVALGDSACITKPYSGEGITAAWVACMIAAEEIGQVMRGGIYPTRATMWNVNVRYQRTQGADFANLMTTLIGAVDCTKDENEYEFKRGIAFDEAVMSQMNAAFANKMTAGQTLALLWRVGGGLLSGNIRTVTAKNLVKAVKIASQLKAHYKRYPCNPSRFVPWCIRADQLWKKAGNMSDCIERTFPNVKENS